MNAYRNSNKNNENIREILRFHEISTLLNEKVKITENIESLSDLMNDNEDMKSLVKEEEFMYKQQLQQIDQEILDTILQNFSIQHYENVIMEITPGVGGQEAMLFARDLLNMYIHYLDYLGFTYELMEMLESETSGLRRAALVVSDRKAFEKLKYEGGVHRVQRIPITERGSRLHTSTAVVTIFPEPSDIDIKLEDKDLKIESMKASGAGGQHVNTTNSAIRITHLPTGKVVNCQTNKSQLKNRQLALMKLKSILYEDQLDKQVSFTSELRKKQMGTRLRNEKIRTYNYHQDRITDHRISNGTLHNLKDFMKSGVYLEELQDRLYKDMQQKTLLEIIEKTKSQLK